MDKTYQPQKVEKRIYSMWERGGWFTPKIDKRKMPFTILLPLPNASDPLHTGHALFTVEDIMARYHRMLGDPTLWLPGGDHAGIETQYVFEKKLAKEGKSRFDFDRETLYQMIVDFVEENKNINRDQLKRLGFSLDWTRYHYSLEPKIIDFVFETFLKLHQNGLIYRGERLVNYCPKCDTAFSDLEVDHVECGDYLYFLDYGPISIATTRPETIFADTAVAVNPKDKRYRKLVGQKAVIPLINKSVPIIKDELIDINFGTGGLKVTPAHDNVDYQIGQKHHLEIIQSIGRNGRMINVPEKYLGLTVNLAREAVVADLEKEKKLLKTEPLRHTIGVCYRCNTTIEPMLMPQWWVKTKPLAALAIKAVKEGRTNIVPKKRFEKMYFDWLENILDWNISRQIVWGPRIPAWYCLECNPKIFINFIDRGGRKISGAYSMLKMEYPFGQIKKGLQSLIAPITATYSLENKPCPKCGSKNILQETDTFDTWFLSGQWPLTTLGFPDSEDFKYFYPTSVLDTLWDILFFWVARMMMLGIYRTGDVPFRVVHIHCRVVDKYGQKMSKSKENVIDPIKIVDNYGADALRLSLVFGAAPGSDIPVSEDKIRAMRNFANKIWNASRFVLAHEGNTQYAIRDTKKRLPSPISRLTHPDDKWILSETKKTVKKVTNLIEKYRFDLAAEEIYHFFWHTFCDKYIERVKEPFDYAQGKQESGRVKGIRPSAYPVLLCVLETSLKLLHPFMPFITEEIWQKLPAYRQGGPNRKQPLIISPWPK